MDRLGLVHILFRVCNIRYDNLFIYMNHLSLRFIVRICKICNLIDGCQGRI